MGLSPNTALVAFAGGVGFLVSLAFKIPPGLEGFRFIALFAAMVGCGIGHVLAKRAASYSFGSFVGIMLLDLIIGSAAAIAYLILIETVLNPELWLVVLLASLLCVIFVCVGCVLPLAGLRFNE